MPTNWHKFNSDLDPTQRLSRKCTRIHLNLLMSIYPHYILLYSLTSHVDFFNVIRMSCLFPNYASPSSGSEDEHQLIKQYCAAMNGDTHCLTTNGSLGVSPIPPLSAMAVAAANLAGPPPPPSAAAAAAAVAVPPPPPTLAASIASPALGGVGPPPGALLPPASTIPSMFLQPRSPAQMLCHIEADQKDELEMMIQELEQENRQLQAEYERLQDMR